jgi:ATP-dependent DNA ligase
MSWIDFTDGWGPSVGDDPLGDNRFGAPLELKRVHWVRPELVAKVTYLTWPKDGLLRAVVYQGLRDDKRAGDVWRG